VQGRPADHSHADAVCSACEQGSGSRLSLAASGVSITVGEYAATYEEIQSIVLDNGGSGFLAANTK